MFQKTFIVTVRLGTSLPNWSLIMFKSAVIYVALAPLADHYSITYKFISITNDWMHFKASLLESQ